MRSSGAGSEGRSDRGKVCQVSCFSRALFVLPPFSPPQQRSRAAEMRDIASGKAQLGARQKGGGLKQLLEAADIDAPVDEVQLFDDDVPPQRF